MDTLQAPEADSMEPDVDSMEPEVSIERVQAETSDLSGELRQRAVLTALAYVVTSGTWIAFSDRLLGYIVDSPEALIRGSVLKGLGFVVVTGFLLLWLLRSTFGDVAAAFAAVQRKEAQRQQAEGELREAKERLEQTVRKRTSELEAALARAESSDRLKSAFLATMSHELRTPLNSIIGFSGILSQGLAGPLNPEQKKQIDIVCRSSEHLLSLINDVLDLSKIEAGQLDVKVESFDLHASVKRTVDAMRLQAEQKGLGLTLDLDPCLGSLTSDQRRVEQVLVNLVSNAVKFTARGDVRVQAMREQSRVVIRVSDTGPGISEVHIPELFRPFSRIESTDTKHHDGTGLGLSICKRLVQLLGGDIWVESADGRGSRFTFVLPIRQVEPS